MLVRIFGDCELDFDRVEMAMVGVAVDRKEWVFVHDGGGSKGWHASNPKF